MLWPGSSLNPVVGSCGVPDPARVPGHMVWGQLFVTVNVQELERGKRKQKKTRKRPFERSDDFVCIVLANFLTFKRFS